MVTGWRCLFSVVTGLNKRSLPYLCGYSTSYNKDLLKHFSLELISLCSLAG